jgi:hypothetical protein
MGMNIVNFTPFKKIIADYALGKREDLPLLACK